MRPCPQVDMEPNHFTAQYYRCEMNAQLLRRGLTALKRRKLPASLDLSKWNGPPKRDSARLAPATLKCANNSNGAVRKSVSSLCVEVSPYPHSSIAFARAQRWLPAWESFCPPRALRIPFPSM